MDEIRLFSPASVANVSCGFDVLGFCLEAIGDEIFSDLGRYRGLLDVLASFDNQEYTVVEAEKFNEYLQKFNFSDNQNDLLEVEEEIFNDDLLDSLD